MTQLTAEECAEHDCAHGCIEIKTGVDQNNNGELDSDEAQDTEYLCHGAPGADGTPGADGAPGTPGADGSDGSDGSDPGDEPEV